MRLDEAVGQQKGRILRDRVLDNLEELRSRLIEVVRERMVKKARSQPVTADDAYDVVEELAEKHPEIEELDRRFLGVVFRSDVFEPTGRYHQSRHPHRHARPVREWTLAKKTQ